MVLYLEYLQIRKIALINTKLFVAQNDENASEALKKTVLLEF